MFIVKQMSCILAVLAVIIVIVSYTSTGDKSIVRQCTCSRQLRYRHTLAGNKGCKVCRTVSLQSY